MAKGLEYISPAELPYIEYVPVDGRRIPLLPFYDHKTLQFFAYSLQPENEILVLSPVKFQEGIYVAIQAADPDLDCHLEFLEIIFKHFSFDYIIRR